MGYFVDAKKARKLYHTIGLAIELNQIKNCPVLTKPVNIAEDIWGPGLAYLKGKTTRRTQNQLCMI